jgi:hypothetical protein
MSQENLVETPPLPVGPRQITFDREPDRGTQRPALSLGVLSKLLVERVR